MTLRRCDNERRKRIRQCKYSVGKREYEYAAPRIPYRLSLVRVAPVEIWTIRRSDWLKLRAGVERGCGAAGATIEIGDQLDLDRANHACITQGPQMGHFIFFLSLADAISIR